MSVYEVARTNMIESQLRPNRVTDQRLLNAFSRVRRELFVPQSLRSVAYVDNVLPLGNGRFVMDPMVAARLIEAAMVLPRDGALVVGAGSGYEAAVLSLLCRSVVALEEDAELARFGRSALVEHRIASVSYAEEPIVAHRARQPYDVIIFGGAVAELPPEIVAQLAEGGRLAGVLRAPGEVGRAILGTRTGGVFSHRAMFDAATPYLPGFQPKPAFVF